MSDSKLEDDSKQAFVCLYVLACCVCVCVCVCVRVRVYAQKCCVVLMLKEVIEERKEVIEKDKEVDEETPSPEATSVERAIMANNNYRLAVITESAHR